MACAGCEGAVRRVLEAAPGVTGVTIDLAAQRVSVTAAEGVTPEAVLAAARASGKAAELWQ